MTPQTLGWFAASSTIIGAVVSIFRPDNGACPINLAPRGRLALTIGLTAAQGFLQTMVGGDDWVTAAVTSLAALVAVMGAHGHTLGDHPLLAQPVAQFRTITPVSQERQ